ncbi:MAG: DUF4350 domain-containing protein [Promethearchaeota archaeon]
MSKLWLRQLMCLVAINLLVVPSLVATAIPSSKSEPNDAFTTFKIPDSEPKSTNDIANGLSNFVEEIPEAERDWYWQKNDGAWQDYRGWLESYRQMAEGIRHYETSYFNSAEPGFSLNEQLIGNRLHITVQVGEYSIITYAFETDSYQALLIEDTEVTTTYGQPTIPFKNLLYSLPEGVHPLSVQIQKQETELISGLSLIPGAAPMHLASSHRTQDELYFSEQGYSDSTFTPVEFLDYQTVGMKGQPGVLVNLHLLQYNPVQKQAHLITCLEFDLVFSASVAWSELTSNPYDSQYNGAGQGYVIVAPTAFLSALNTFVQWKSDLGFDVSITTIENVYATYSGRDRAEQLRNFVIASFTENATQYFLLVGDCDVVPTREVWDPYLAGGLDNGTEPSDMYFECLDGDWDANANNLFGEADDAVDFFPEVSVGRLPVQTLTEAEDVLSGIIQLESNPSPGNWMDDFLLIGPDCFGMGDGANMLEEELNQWFLYDSFFDVHRLYPTDGSLSNTNVISRLNTGVGIVDFFDHGWYGGWVGALNEEDYGEVSGLVNGARRPFAFAMACETAAFDAEFVEPTIGEAFFRNPNGGAVAYIGATRIAWAGYHAFDGLHHRFWRSFFETALQDQLVSPKQALQSALYEMVTTYSMSDPISLETVYQAIYFGDPSMQLYWKYKVTNTATPVEVNEQVQLNGTCSMFFNKTPIVDAVNVVVRDPIGRIVYINNHLTDSQGNYTATFSVNELAGNYTVSTTISQAFLHTTINTFYVGNLSVAVQLDSTPTYHSLLAFSGSANKDGAANASLVDTSGNIQASKLFTITGGTYSETLNVTEFGWLQLFIFLTNETEHGGVSEPFQVTRGEILVIADSSGGWGPDYPGGWADNNYGDSTNTGDFVIALKDEYHVFVYRPRYNLTPSLLFLESFDAVIVSVGDNYGYPLIAPDSFLLDVLHSYHNSGGNLLLEGCQISTTLASTQYNQTFESFTHTDYSGSLINSPSITLVNQLHTITSGLPSTISLLGGLGTPYADIIIPINGSERVSGYLGEPSPGSAITALTPTQSYGGVVYFAFSIDAIGNQNHRNLIIQNAVAYLLQPRLEATLSDDALQTGTSEVIFVEVLEAATSQPVFNANVTFLGCGVMATNQTLTDGTCSIFITPTTEGLILVSINKLGYLNFTAVIIVYDIPTIAVETNPSYLEKYESQLLTIRTTDYYEHFPLDTCFVNVIGCGVSDSGYTNSSGLVEFTVTPTASGLIAIGANLTGYINVTSSIGVRYIAVVLPSAGTMYPSDFCWDEINLNWQDYGSIPIFINYTAFPVTNTSFSLADLEAINADALIIPYVFEAFSPEEIDAVTTYVRAGHGLFTSGYALYLNPETLGPFFGLIDNITFSANFVPSFDILQPLHPVFENLPDPFSTYYGLSFHPLATGWDSSVLDGAIYLAKDTSGYNYGTVLTHRGMIFTSHHPELLSNRDDTQLVYNALAWSKFAIPDHDLRVTLDVPDYCEPGDTTKINATVFNEGKNNETNLLLQLFINDLEVATLPIAELANFTSQTLTYLWNPSIEAIYNITAYVAPVPDEYSNTNNVATHFVHVRYIQGWILWDDIHSTDSMMSYSTWLTDLVALGYVIEAVSFGSITSTLLDDYHILICAQPHVSYSSSEQTAIHSFVTNGGGLLVIGDDTPSIFDSLTQFAGIDWESGGVSGTTTDITLHPVTENVSSAYFGAPISRLIVSGQAISLIRNGGETLLAAAEVGPGRVIGIGDEDCINEYAINQADNRQLALNMIAWLTVQYPHEVLVELETPSYANPGEQLSLNMTVWNRGTENETNLTLQLFINESLIDTYLIPKLNASHSTRFTKQWTPSGLGYYNITAYVLPVPLENITWNNRDTNWVLIRNIYAHLLYDFTHGNQLPQNFSIWFEEVLALGIAIDVLYAGPISAATLIGYDGLISVTPFYNYSTPELTTIQSFVDSGGALLVVGEWAPEVCTSLTSFAGITFIEDWNVSTVTDITPHTITQGVDSLDIGYLGARLDVSPVAMNLARTVEGKCVLAAFEDIGRVIGFTSSLALTDYRIGNMDNLLLAINMVAWMVDDNLRPSVPVLQAISDIITTSEFPASWSEASDPDGYIVTYQLQVALDDLFSTIYQTVVTTITTSNVTVSSDGVYYLRVRSQDNEYRYSLWSNVISVTVELANLAPTAPTLSLVRNDDGSITCTWTTSTDPDGQVVSYLLQCSNFPTFLLVYHSWTVNHTSIIIASLEPGMHYFRVAAIDDEGAYSLWSNSCDMLIPGIPNSLLIGIAALLVTTVGVVLVVYWIRIRRKESA